MVRKFINRKKKFFAVMAMSCLVLTWVFVVADVASAAGGGGGSGMPWETGLVTLTDSITGPVAQAIGLIAIVAAGAALIFGGDMTGFMRTTVYIVLVLGLILSASTLLKTFSGTSANVPFII
jgi:type IV secretion system protein VirB2